ncbi:MAG: hypothetical protein IPL46_30615 [Saprospiraceae bacterium]|nr:hypothetical protein [Saprospiraceae bacterium]
MDSSNYDALSKRITKNASSLSNLKSPHHDLRFSYPQHNPTLPYGRQRQQKTTLDHWNISERSSRSERRYKALVKFLSKQLAIDNQSHFRAYADGDVRTVCTALYPIEQGFTEVRNFLASVAENVFINERKLIAAVIGISEEAVEVIHATNYKYFISLARENGGQG